MIKNSPKYEETINYTTVNELWHFFVNDALLVSVS